MITVALRLVLLFFAAIGFGGAGASLAIARYRYVADGENDVGMLGVALMLFLFGGLCTTASAGLSGIPAIGGVIAWASYVVVAQHLGMFRIETHRPAARQEARAEETRRAP